MKSVVLEIKENKAAVLDDNGIVHAVKNKDYKVGQVLYLTEFEMKRDEVSPAKRHSALMRTAAAILAVAVISGGVTSYAAPVSTVTLDGASSVEYRLNLYDRVVGADAPDGADEEFRKEISDFSKEIRGMEINDAIDATTARFGNEMFRPDADGNRPDISIKVGGLKKNSRHLSDQMDHKREEIKDNMPDNAPAPEDTAEKMKDTDNAEKDADISPGNTTESPQNKPDERPDSKDMDNNFDQGHNTNDPGMEKPASDDGGTGVNEPAENKRTEEGKPTDHGIPNEQSGAGKSGDNKGPGDTGGNGNDIEKPDDAPASSGGTPPDDMGRPSDSPPADDMGTPSDAGNGGAPPDEGSHDDNRHDDNGHGGGDHGDGGR